MIRALLVDDEESAIHWLTDLLSSHASVEVVGTATSIFKAESLLREIPVDVVFLDIEMPRRNGFELFSYINSNIKVVMITAHDNHAIQAYELGAIDYLLKPVSPQRLSLTLKRLSSVPDPDGPPPSNFSTDQILVSIARGMVRVEVNQILWIEARENYSLVQIGANEPLLVKRTLNEWSQKLPKEVFVKIDRSTIVHLDRIQSVHWQLPDDSRVSFRGTTHTLLPGRTGASRLKRILEGENA